MRKVKDLQPYTFSCNGKDLAKVLMYYGLIPDATQSDYKIICPFHEDVNPSMIVDLEKGIYYCFGCNKSGDALTFVQDANKDLNTLQSVFKLFDILKSKKVRKIQFNNSYKKAKRQTMDNYNIAHDYYYGLSTINWVKDKSTDVQDLKLYMQSRGFNAITLNKCNAKITYNNSYPIIFPMMDNGEFKGWVCRTTNLEVQKKRKYLYNEGFSRATTLVGNYGKEDYVFVVEGYMDRLRFLQNGVENVVAILGWKMSHEQEIKIKNCKNIKYVISALDNDKCGIKGTEYLRTIFPNVLRFNYIKGIKDPGEMSDLQFKKMFGRTINKLNRIKSAQDKQKR
jgi:DNA primase